MTEIIMEKKKRLWVPLHVHSEYSALDGAIRIPRYYEFALEQGFPAAAVTDHFNMSAWAEFDRTFQEVKPIFGCELYANSMLKGGPAVPFTGRKRYHLNSFALSKKGLINLQKLAARGYCADDESAAGPYAVSLSAMEEFHEDVAFSSACLSGELSVLLMNGLEDKARQFIDTMCGMLGKENFYIEILGIDYADQDTANRILIDFARKHNIQMLLTTDSHYMPEDVSWYNALLAGQKRQTLTDEETASAEGDIAERFSKWDITGQMDLSMRTPEAIWEKYGQLCPEGIEGTVRFAERAERFTLRGDKYMLPHMGSTAVGFRDKAVAGLERRLEHIGIPGSERIDYHDRLNMEMNIVESMGFIEYFCLVEDLVSSCRSRGIKVGPGRGSAAGSMLAWSLGITELDPLKFGLLFERFLNPERISMPDIDIDFEDDRRQEAIDYLKSKYGDSAVVAISNYSRCKWKNGIRDAARVLGAQPWQGDSLVKALEGLIDTSFTADENEDFEVEEEVTSDYLIRYITGGKNKNVAELGEERIRSILELAGHFNGILRNYGKHASGIVISPGRADDFVPLGRVKGSIATQFNMDDVDYCKLVKVDILGLSTLSMIKEIEEEAKKFSSSSLPTPVMSDFVTFINKCGALKPEDCADIKSEEAGITQESVKRTFDLFGHGNTTGVFQFAGSGMRNLLRKIRPSSLEDLSAAVALFRPGPLNSGITNDYIRAKNRKAVGEENPGKSFPQSMREKIDRIASDTCGMIIYQEHIMKVAREIAGYTLGEADMLRKAIGKKKKELMETERAKFIDKCLSAGYESPDASQAFDTIEFFAGYGFNKSHSCCYASLAFMTAWYAANRSPLFWAALVNDTVKKQRKDSRGQMKIAPILREAGCNMKVFAPMLLGNFGDTSPELMRKTRCILDIDSNVMSGSGINRTENITDDLWNSDKCWTLALGLSAAKGVGKRDSGVKKLLNLGLDINDTLKDFVIKGVLNDDPAAAAAGGALFLNGFFDRIFDNTLKAEKIYISPVFMRLAVINMADVENMQPDIKSAVMRACCRFSAKKTVSDDLPFKITKSRSVFGSFLEYAVKRLRAQMEKKKNPWTENDVRLWVEDYFTPVISAIAREASMILERMKDDHQYRMNAMLSIYRIEKDDFGESLTVSDWGMASEMTGYTFTMYADEAQKFRQSCIERKWAVRRTGREEAEDEGRYVVIKQMSKEDGFWVLGQFAGAAWKDRDGKKSGYISLEGRYGQRDMNLYITTGIKLPLINIDIIKKVQAAGGYIAVKVRYDFEKNSFDLVSEKGDTADPAVSCGIENLPSGIAVLPMLVPGNRRTGDNKPGYMPMTPLRRRGGITGRHISTSVSKLSSRAYVDALRTKFFFRYWRDISEPAERIRIIARRAGEWMELPHPKDEE